MTRATLVDIGINLAHDSYDADRVQVIERARAAGVPHLIVTGSSIASTRRAIELVREHPAALRATAGVHPHHAHEFSAEQRTELQALMQAEEVCAAGECGLDYFRDFSPRMDQQRVFRAQLELAVATRRPVFLHQRDGHADFISILRDYLPRLPAAVAHCFTGTRAELDECLALGLYIGITGWINDERRGQLLQELVVSIPAELIMLETDGPYLLPRDLTPRPASRRNEPMFLPHILATVARLRGVAADTLAAQTTANVRRFFGWPATS
ncbi:MAG TPA: TatD family hydrolase [Steroidobacteraceae bacterium]|nr:TatD family hydrolase [Steroidobacteraceae bacterium]